MVCMQFSRHFPLRTTWILLLILFTSGGLWCGRKERISKEKKAREHKRKIRHKVKVHKKAEKIYNQLREKGQITQEDLQSLVEKQLGEGTSDGSSDEEDDGKNGNTASKDPLLADELLREVQKVAAIREAPVRFTRAQCIGIAEGCDAGEQGFQKLQELSKHEPAYDQACGKGEGGVLWRHTAGRLQGAWGIAKGLYDDGNFSKKKQEANDKFLESSKAFKKGGENAEEATGHVLLDRSATFMTDVAVHLLAENFLEFDNLKKIARKKIAPGFTVLRDRVDQDSSPLAWDALDKGANIFWRASEFDRGADKPLEEGYRLKKEGMQKIREALQATRDAFRKLVGENTDFQEFLIEIPMTGNTLKSLGRIMEDMEDDDDDDEGEESKS